MDATVVPEEEWRVVADFPIYEVSNLGQARRRFDAYKTTTTGKRVIMPRQQAGRLLRPALTNGYRCVALHRDGKQRTVKLAVMVCTAFHGPRPSARHLVAHGNGVRTDDVWTNLRWATALENSEDSLKHGTRAFGERCGSSKITASEAIEIRKLIADGVRYKEIGARFGLETSTLTAIKKRQTWAWVDD